MPEAAQTNGHSSDKKPQNGEDEVQVTKAFAELVTNTTQGDLTPDLSTKLKALLLDYFGVSIAAGKSAESTPVILAGVKAFAGNATGNCTVLTQGHGWAPQYAALLNGAFAHSYDFDDTHANAILHPGCSVISASLAEAETQKSNGRDFLLALVVGYEVCCRVGMALNTGSYKRGFHNTGTAGVFGSVAAICKLRKSSAKVVENAFGLALSKAGGSMQFLDNGSWNKRLHPGFAAHDALLCVSLAEAGVVGATKPFEGKYGATALFSETGSPNGMTKDLGQHWTFVETACKPYPACRMTHGLLEMTDKFKKSIPDKVRDVLPKSITIHLPPANYPIVGIPQPNKIHPVSVVDAQFSAYFQTAASWIHGSNLGWAIYEHVGQQDPPDLKQLSERITVEIDESYKNLESRMRVEYEDGTVLEDEVTYPIAEPQRPFEWDTGVQGKFLGMVVPVLGEEKAKRICGVVDRIEGCEGVGEVMALLG